MPIPIIHPQIPPNLSRTPATLDPINPSHRHGPVALELRDALATLLSAHDIPRGPHLGLYYCATDRNTLLCVVEMPVSDLEAGRWRDIGGAVRGLLEERGLWGPPRNVGVRYYGSDGAAREKGVVVQTSATSASRRRLRLLRRPQREGERCDDESRWSSSSLETAMASRTQQRLSFSNDQVSLPPINDFSLPLWPGLETSDDFWDPAPRRLDNYSYRSSSRSRPQRRPIPESMAEDRARLEMRVRMSVFQTGPRRAPWETPISERQD